MHMFNYPSCMPRFNYPSYMPRFNDPRSHTVQNYPSYTQTCVGSSIIKCKHAQVQLSRITYCTELSFICINMPRFKYDQTQTCPGSTMIKHKLKFHITHKNSYLCHINSLSFKIHQNTRTCSGSSTIIRIHKFHNKMSSHKN